MPCFLKVIVGSKSVADASALRPGPESCTSIATWPLWMRVTASTDPPAPRRLRGILQQIGQDALHEIRSRVHARSARVEPEIVDRFGVRGPEQRHALGDERIDVEDFAVHRRLAGEFRERPHAPFERFDFADDDLHGLIHEDAIGWRLARQHLFDGQPDRRQRILHLVRGLARE